MLFGGPKTCWNNTCNNHPMQPPKLSISEIDIYRTANEVIKTYPDPPILKPKVKFRGLILGRPLAHPFVVFGVGDQVVVMPAEQQQHDPVGLV